MELIRWMIIGQLFLRPKHATDLPMFKHCTGGLVAVKESIFEAEVWPILQAHGAQYNWYSIEPEEAVKS